MAAPTEFGAASWAKAVAGAASSASANVRTPAWKSLVCMATDSTSDMRPEMMAAVREAFSNCSRDRQRRHVGCYATVRFVREFHRSPVLAAVLVVAVAAAHAQQAAPAREPA